MSALPSAPFDFFALPPRPVTFKRRHWAIRHVETKKALGMAFGEDETIARLFAASPRMLEALKAAEWSGTDGDGDPSTWWPCCPLCGAPSPDCAVEPEEATPDAHPGIHEADCLIGIALAEAEKRA